MSPTQDQFGEIYSQYYDLLYSDKDYIDEVEYVNNLINSNVKNVKTILDLGCGTGKHAELFCNKGYIVHGIDVSKDMIKIAETRCKGKEKRLKFTHSNILDLNLNKKFDVVVALFHVMSYQNSNEEVIKTLKVAKNHLSAGRIFIFDFWYGPAVLTNLPTTRVKRFENHEIKITRIAEPSLNAQTNIVYVNYELFIENKKTNKIINVKELHKMRYFFDTELEMLCNKVGFKIVSKYQWMTFKKPDFNSWSVVWVVKK